MRTMTKSNGETSAGHQQSNRLAERDRLISVIGGGALALVGMRRRQLALPLALIGGGLIVRGVTGRELSSMLDHATEQQEGISLRAAITINRPPDDLYAFWRNLEKLPRFMDHIERVTDLGAGRSHWVARGPGDMALEWDAQLTEDPERRILSWKTLPDAAIEQSGQVRFVPAPDGEGTEVRLSMWYSPPAGAAGQAIAKLLRAIPKMELASSLHRLKQSLETGQIATTSGQSSARSKNDARANDASGNNHWSATTRSEAATRASDASALMAQKREEQS